jgi:hypothetical protein
MAVCDRFIVNVYHSLFAKRIDLVQYEWWCQFKTRYYWGQMLRNLVLMKALRKLEWLAQQRMEETYLKRHWRGWQEYFTAEKNMGDTMYHEYLLKVCAKVLNSFKLEVEEGRRYLAHLNEQFDAQESAKKAAEEAEAEAEAAAEAPVEEEEEEVDPEAEPEPELTEEEREARSKAQAEQEAAEEEERRRLAVIERERKEAMRKQALEALRKRVTWFQAAVRGALQRAKFEERKVEVFSAIQLMQNQFRRVLARLLVRRMKRTRDLAVFLSEERETNDMWRQDQFSQLYRTCFEAAFLVQRVFRGWRGRVQGAILAYNISREKNAEWYQAGEDFRANLEALRRELEIQRKRRYGAAQMIQKRGRGMTARIRFIRVKALAKKVSLTIAVQRDYRARLGTLKLLAMRRDKHAEIRYRAARAQRGMILRALGFKKRKEQAVFGLVLDALGIDPMSYNYRFNELVNETIEDFWKTLAIMKREYVFCYTIVLPSFFSCVCCLSLPLSYQSISACLHSLTLNDV